MAKHFKNNDVYGPITTDLIGKPLWSETSDIPMVVRAVFFQSGTGFTFLLEDEKGQLLEENYGVMWTREPSD